MVLISYSTAIPGSIQQCVDVVLAVLGEKLDSVISEAFSNLLDSAIPWWYKCPSSPWPAQAQPAVLSRCWDPSGQSGCLQAAQGPLDTGGRVRMCCHPPEFLGKGLLLPLQAVYTEP